MNSAKNDNLETELGNRNFEKIVRFSKFWEKFRLQSGSHTLKTLLLRLELCCTPFQIVIIVPDQTISHLQSENSCWIHQILVAFKI